MRAEQRPPTRASFDACRRTARCAARRSCASEGEAVARCSGGLYLPGAAQAGAAAFRAAPRAGHRGPGREAGRPAGRARRGANAGGSVQARRWRRSPQLERMGEKIARPTCVAAIEKSKQHDARALHLRARHPPRRRGDGQGPRAPLRQPRRADGGRRASAARGARRRPGGCRRAIARRSSSEPHNREVIEQLRAARRRLEGARRSRKRAPAVSRARRSCSRNVADA